MEVITGKLKFNEGCNSYGLIKQNGQWQHPKGLNWYTFDRLNCGKTMQVKIGNRFVQTRLEKSERGWYLVGTKYYGDLNGLKVKFCY